MKLNFKSLVYTLCSVLALGVVSCEQNTEVQEFEPSVLDKTTLDVDVEGGTATIGVVAGSDWGVFGGPTWIQVSPNSGSAGEAVICMIVEPNEALDSRSATLIFKDEVGSTEVTLNQAGVAPMVRVRTFELPSNSGVSSFEITSNCAWNITGADDVDWLTISPEEGTGDCEVSVVFTDNSDTYDSRSVKLTIHYGEGKSTEFELTQHGAEPAQSGSFYYADGSYSNEYDVTRDLIGLVFEVEDDGRSGVIFSTAETEAAWGEDGEFFGVDDEDDGMANMAKVKSMDDDFSEFPAFKFCDDMNPEGTDYSDSDQKGIWFLPSLREGEDLQWAAVAVDYYDAQLGDAGEQLLSQGGYYWTSTEVYENGSWGFVFSNRYYLNTRAKESTNHIVRCIMKY